MGLLLPTPLYITFFIIGAIFYLIGAFLLGVISAVLTLPVLYYTGYGLLPPQLTPAPENADFSVAVPVHLGFGGLFAAFSLIATRFTSGTVPSLVQYRFARISPRLETLPKLGLAVGIVLLLWAGYLLYARKPFDGETPADQRAGLLPSSIAALVFGICLLSVAVLTTATVYV